CIPADAEVGRGDRFVAGETAAMSAPVIAVVTMADLVGRDTLAAQLLAVAALGDFAEVVPVSSVSGENIDVLTELLLARMPAGPRLYPDGELTDEPDRVVVAELVREAALEGVRDELPHSIAVEVEEMGAREGRPDLLDVYAVVYVERPSQKAIVVGAGGSRIRDVGTRARAQIEGLLGSKIYLDLHVKVAKDWQRDPRALNRLGF
ncbi:MAG: GTPase Era, partial [Pseudonocardia sp.]|nr:GTPase Era [Pseudonocardia sp.]